MARYTGEVAKEYVGDKDLAMQYTPVARTLLGSLHEMSGGNWSGIRRVLLPDGAAITVSFAGALEKISIDVRNVEKKPDRVPRLSFALLPFQGTAELYVFKPFGFTQPFLSNPPYATFSLLDKTARGTFLLSYGREYIYPEYEYALPLSTGTDYYEQQRELFAGPVEVIYKGVAYSYTNSYHLDRYAKYPDYRIDAQRERTPGYSFIYAHGRVIRAIPMVGESDYMSGLGVLANGRFVVVITGVNTEITKIVDRVYLESGGAWTQIGIREYSFPQSPRARYTYYFSQSGLKAIAQTDDSPFCAPPTSGNGVTLIHLQLSVDQNGVYSASFSYDTTSFPTGLVEGPPNYQSGTVLWRSDYVGEELRHLCKVYPLTYYTDISTTWPAYTLQTSGQLPVTLCGENNVYNSSEGTPQCGTAPFTTTITSSWSGHVEGIVACDLRRNWFIVSEIVDSGSTIVSSNSISEIDEFHVLITTSQSASGIRTYRYKVLGADNPFYEGVKDFSGFYTSSSIADAGEYCFFGKRVPIYQLDGVAIVNNRGDFVFHTTGLTRAGYGGAPVIGGAHQKGSTLVYSSTGVVKRMLSAIDSQSDEDLSICLAATNFGESVFYRDLV